MACMSASLESCPRAPQFRAYMVMRTYHRAIRYLATRNAQTTAELCSIPTTPWEWAHWAIWLIIAMLE